MHPEEKNRINEILFPLIAVFPNWNAKPETLKVYQAVLQDLDPDLLADAVLDLVSDPREFMPTPGVIREAALILEDAADDIPSAYEGWEQVERDFRSLTSERGKAHPLVDKAIKRIGGWTSVGQSTNPTAERARFIDAYRELRAENHKERRRLPQVKQRIALMAKRQSGLPMFKDDPPADGQEDERPVVIGALADDPD